MRLISSPGCMLGAVLYPTRHRAGAADVAQQMLDEPRAYSPNSGVPRCEPGRTRPASFRAALVPS